MVNCEGLVLYLLPGVLRFPFDLMMWCQYHSKKKQEFLQIFQVWKFKGKNIFPLFTRREQQYAFTIGFSLLPRIDFKFLTNFPSQHFQENLQLFAVTKDGDRESFVKIH